MALGPGAPIVIIGAGPTGLGAAGRLHQQGHDNWLLYERQAEVGGLSRSFRDQAGYTWDLGGHVVFSHYGYFSRLLEGLWPPQGWLRHQRESWIRIKGRWVPYPFQYNFHYLDPADCAACLEGLARAALERPNTPPRHFGEFLRRTYGQGLADIFMTPYNRKVWAYEPEELSATWIQDRLALPDLPRVARNVVLRQDDVSWGPNNRFLFPARGGTGAIWQALAQRLPQDHLRLGREVTAVDPLQRVVIFADGLRQPYSRLVSTMPLDQLAAMCGQPRWRELAGGLRHSAVHVVGLGLTGRPGAELASKCWMYFPEYQAPFFRLTHFSLYSPANVDDIGQHWSLLAEVSESPSKPVDASRVVEETIQGLLACGLIKSAGQVVHTWLRREEYAYPTPSLGRDQAALPLLKELMAHDIYSRGRFGAWLYEVGNMDHSYMQGVEVADHLLCGSPELTLWHPHVVNQPHPVVGWDLWS